MQDRTLTDQIAGVENARPVNSDVNKTTKFKTKTRNSKTKSKTKTKTMADETYIKTQIIAPTMVINRWQTEIILINGSKLS